MSQSRNLLLLSFAGLAGAYVLSQTASGGGGGTSPASGYGAGGYNTGGYGV